MRTDDRHARRDLAILQAIGEGRPLTQRALAQRVGVALGLTNLYLKRLARKGFIKVTALERRRAAYLLTPRGLAEQTRLTYEYLGRSLALYRGARGMLRDALAHLSNGDRPRVALYGTGEAAELAYLTLREFNLEPVGVFDDDGPRTFLGFPVQPLGALAPTDVDRVVVATFDRPHARMLGLIERGVPAAKLVPLRPVTHLRRRRSS